MGAALIVLVGGIAGFTDVKVSLGSEGKVKLQVATAGPRLVVGESIVPTDDGATVTWRGGTEVLKEKISEVVEVTFEAPQGRDAELMAFDTAFRRELGQVNDSRSYDRAVAMERNLLAKASWYLRTCDGASRFRRLWQQCLSAQATATSGRHQFDNRAIQILTRALRIDPCAEWHIKAIHWWTYHVHDAPTEVFPEDDPDPQIRRKIVSRQQQLSSQLQEERAIWDKELVEIAKMPLNARSARIEVLLKRIQRFCAPDDLWTLHVIRKSEENPNTYVGRCRFLLVEQEVSSCVFTQKDLDTLATNAMRAIEVLPRDFDQAEELEWIQVFATKAIDLLKKAKDGKINPSE